MTSADQTDDKRKQATRLTDFRPKDKNFSALAMFRMRAVRGSGWQKPSLSST
jgi:hypothetical protein